MYFCCMKTTQTISQKRIWLFFALIIFLSQACTTHRKGMRKRKKNDCDCPSFSWQEKKPQQHTFQFINT